MPRSIRTAAAVALAAAVLVPAARLRAEPPAAPAEFATAEGLVASLYREVTFEPGAMPDWDRVRSMFLDRATVVLRTGREETTVFSVEGFIDDFVAFADRADVKQRGFEERVVRSRPLVVGDIAHVLVVYEARVPGSPRPPQQGVDSFQLVRREGRWWIVSVTNEIPTPERPLPEDLRD